MATKNNPGKYDCYANAEPDEPMFVLLARDELAPVVVRIWAALRYGSLTSAEAGIRLGVEIGKSKTPMDKEKLKEAQQCADAMEAWIKVREKEHV